MLSPILYIAITNHGFGHAVRAASVAATIQKLCPDILLILVTTAPRWLLETYIQGDFIYRPRAFDIGIIQPDSLNMDKVATLEKLREIRSRQNSIIAGEVNFIRQNRVELILADIPPLAPLIAKAADIPCYMLSNFGWDYIYRYWGGDFVEIADWIGECYQKADRLFRLPLHESMSAFSNITDVGFTGGNPRYSEEELRRKFSLTAPTEKTILLTFGGLSLQQIPYSNLDYFPDWQFITFDRQAPELPNLFKVSGHEYRPVDFIPFCGRVISKPGYSTFAEALRVGTPISSLTRRDFAESALLIQGIQDYSYHQVLTDEEFFEKGWEFLHQAPQPTKRSQEIDKNGNEAIAQDILDYFQSY